MTEKKTEASFPFFFDWNLIETGGFHEHTHDFRELAIMTGGTGLHSAGGDTYPVSSGDVFVMDAGQRHGFRECRDLEVFSLGFDREILRPLDTGDFPALKALLITESALRSGGELTARLHLPPGQAVLIRDLLQGIAAEWSEKQPGYIDIVRNLLENLIIHIARYYGSESNPPGHSLTRLTECMNVIETEFASDLDLKQIAGAYGYPYSTFRDEVKRVYGTTPLQYLIHLRLARAAELLRDTDERISTIGYDCGFEDSNYFSRMFKKETGSSPREYRSSRKKTVPGPTTPVSP